MQMLAALCLRVGETHRWTPQSLPPEEEEEGEEEMCHEKVLDGCI